MADEGTQEEKAAQAAADAAVAAEKVTEARVEAQDATPHEKSEESQEDRLANLADAVERLSGAVRVLCEAMLEREEEDAERWEKTQGEGASAAVIMAAAPESPSSSGGSATATGSTGGSATAPGGSEPPPERVGVREARPGRGSRSAWRRFMYGRNLRE